jgi:hypothetical protein
MHQSYVRVYVNGFSISSEFLLSAASGWSRRSFVSSPKADTALENYLALGECCWSTVCGVISLLIVVGIVFRISIMSVHPCGVSGQHEDTRSRPRQRHMAVNFVAQSGETRLEGFNQFLHFTSARPISRRRSVNNISTDYRYMQHKELRRN